MTPTQKALLAATVAVLAGVAIYKARQAARLSDRIRTLQQIEPMLRSHHSSSRLERLEGDVRIVGLGRGSRLPGMSNPV
jgi:hypothetical protein